MKCCVKLIGNVRMIASKPVSLTGSDLKVVAVETNKTKHEETMKHKNLKKVVENYAPVVSDIHGKNTTYSAQLQGIIISWTVTWYSPEEASLVRVRHSNDNDEWTSDYCAGTFYDTIKSAITAFTYKYNLKKTV